MISEEDLVAIEEELIPRLSGGAALLRANLGGEASVLDSAGPTMAALIADVRELRHQLQDRQEGTTMTGPVMVGMDAEGLFRAERMRHIHSEGYTPKKDIGRSEELAAAANCYFVTGSSDPYNQEIDMDLWPWEAKFWKPKDPFRDLVRAGALYMAAEQAEDRQLMADVFAGARATVAASLNALLLERRNPVKVEDTFPPSQPVDFEDATSVTVNMTGPVADAGMREFGTDTLLSVYTGLMLSDMDRIGDMLAFMVDGPLMTHHLPAAADRVKPELERQFPWLLEISAPSGRVPDDLKRRWLLDLETTYGETVRVARYQWAENGAAVGHEARTAGDTQVLEAMARTAGIPTTTIDQVLHADTTVLDAVTVGEPLVPVVVDTHTLDTTPVADDPLATQPMGFPPEAYEAAAQPAPPVDAYPARPPVTETDRATFQAWWIEREGLGGIPLAPSTLAWVAYQAGLEAARS